MNKKSRFFDIVIYRPVWLPSLVLGIFLLISLSLLVNLSWRSHERLVPIHNHLIQLNRLQDLGLRLQQDLIDILSSDKKKFTQSERGHIQAELTSIFENKGYLVSETPAQIRAAIDALGSYTSDKKLTLIVTLQEIRKVLDAEIHAHDTLLTKVRRETLLEYEISTLTLVVFPLIALMILYLLRRRILLPIKHLSHLMTLLANQTYGTVSVQEVDPILQSLTNNYNTMVSRLAELEDQNQARQESLENQVRIASRTLLEQQRTLDNTEQLAAVGEIAARIAHELRNPLAAIEMSLSNLRDESHDQEYAERLDRLIMEMNRISLLLENLLDQSRHDPEPATCIKLARTIRDLLALTRYQVPDTVQIEYDIPEALECCLPEDRLRQTVLNLILNAAQAMGEKPGTIMVTASRKDGQLKLSVCDEGPGFSQEFLREGIQPFHTRKVKGTGLGLAMVKRFARDLEGDLQLSNRDTQGACVTLILPCTLYYE